ncbi:MAG: hypothetical protein WCI92_16205, partial [Bacteroidota bacterium]
LNILYRRILEQPLWYLEAVELHPDTLPVEDKLFERAKSVFYRIEHVQDKFNEVIVSVKHQLRDLVKNDKDSAVKLFNEILFIMDSLILSVGRYGFDDWYFDYKKSPLFVFLMEFIQEIKNRAGNSAEYYPEVEAYLSNINLYKEQFKEVSTPDNLIQKPQPIANNQNGNIDNFENFIQEEILFWSNSDPVWKNFFEIKVIKTSITVSTLILKNNPKRFKLMSDFVKGFALFPLWYKSKNEQYGLEFDSLTKPVMDLQIQYFRSENWQRAKIGKEVTGQDTLQVNDVTIPITQEALLLHIQRTNTLILTTESVIKLERDWRNYIRAKYQDEDTNTDNGINANYTPAQLSIIFDKLLKLRFVKVTDKKNFIAVFQDQPLPIGWKKITWCGSRSRKKFHYFYCQITGVSEPSAMNQYFVHTSNKAFDSNDKPVAGYSEIDSLLQTSKAMK